MTPEIIKLNIANRKIVRLKNENEKLNNKFKSIRKDYVELLKVLCDEVNFMTKLKIKSIIKDLEIQNE